VQVPDAFSFEQGCFFAGDAGVMFKANNVYPDSSGFAFLDQHIGNAELEGHWGPWTAEDERNLAEILA